MNIGITCNGNIENLFDNGICFNVILWYDFLEICGYNPYFIVYEKDNPINFIKKKAIDKEYNFLTYNNNIQQLNDNDVFKTTNLIFEIGLFHKEFLDLCLVLKKKTIHVILGSTYLLDIQNIIDSSYKHYTDTYTNYYQIWISPHFEFSKEYIEIRNKTPVYVCPYFWRDDMFKKNKLLENVNKNFDKLNIAIMEPNINYCKNCLVPITICEKGEKEIDSVFVFCSYKLKNIPMFKNFVMNLDLWKNKKISCENRVSIVDILSKYCNCVVSCVEKCDLNYVFLECFYLGIPLIHNSKMLKDYGYYYSDLSVSKGAEYFEIIKKTHNREKYIEKHKEVLHKYSIDNLESQKWVKNKINNIFS